MRYYKDLSDLLERSSEAYKYYSSLSYEVQEMLDDARPYICNENDLIYYINNYAGLMDY